MFVMRGHQCRLDNISREERWLEPAEFVHGNSKVREAGEKVPASLIKLEQKEHGQAVS